MAVGASPYIPIPSACRGERDVLPKVNDSTKSEKHTYQLQKIIGEGGYGVVFESQSENGFVVLNADLGVRWAKLNLNWKPTIFSCQNEFCGEAKKPGLVQYEEYGAWKLLHNSSLRW